MGLEVLFEGVNSMAGFNGGWWRVPSLQSRDRKRLTRELSLRSWDVQQRGVG